MSVSRQHCGRISQAPTALCLDDITLYIVAKVYTGQRGPPWTHSR